MKYSVLGQTLTLLPQKAIYWEAQDTILLADVHLGKATHFRKHGLAVPMQTELQNLDQLSALLHVYQPQRLIILGDLFHHRFNSTWDLFIAWRKQFSEVEMILVIGNHDILKPELYDAAGLMVYRETYIIDPFVLSHHPLVNVPEQYFNIAGHIHPAIKLRLTTKETVVLRCFYFQPHNLTMPAFGAFTGNFIIKPEADDAIFAIVNESVIKI